jgi:hypothetical protein
MHWFKQFGTVFEIRDCSSDEMFSYWISFDVQKRVDR